ncbi:hypothetical protein A3860_18200 [Niastella vici]|uniref:Uncharacterized protein n=1 Tax=Niastella vici TaxID=1703345 RepID=A0A1V9G2B0_9BACT|nr:hypothetical protein A3860_18200 [Niastella vici]
MVHVAETGLRLPGEPVTRYMLRKPGFDFPESRLLQVAGYTVHVAGLSLQHVKRFSAAQNSSLVTSYLKPGTRSSPVRIL